MNVYWDTSAIVFYYAHGRIAEIAGYTRPHSLAETYSALTGGGFEMVMPDGSRKHKRLSMGSAAMVIKLIAPKFSYVELSPEETMAAINTAKSKSAQGGRIHDLMHAAAAEKAGADELWTIDRNDFIGLGSVPLRQLSL